MSGTRNFPPHISRYRAIEAMELPETIPAVLDRAARLFGDAPAIDFFERGEAMGFATLAATARRLAHGLHGLGIRKGSHVGVLLPNRIEYPVIWLALAELGAAMVPIVLGSTAREIAYFIEDGDAEFLITTAALITERELQPGSGGIPGNDRIVLVDEPDARFRSYADLVSLGDPAFTPPDPPAAGDLLSIQYTSGTTGLPKGVMLSHRYWVIAGSVGTLAWGQSFASLLSDAPFFYMDAQWMLFAALYSGARVDFTERMSVRKWVGWLHERRTELAWFTDPVLKLPPVPEEKDTAVKLFLGYAMSPAMIAEAEERFGAPVREAYGMTEISMGLVVPWEVEDAEIMGTCGSPAPFRRCRIVRTDGSDAEDGEPGELWFAGDGLLDGYYKRPEATATAFVDGWFRTGDLAVRDAKGYYRIIGRIKEMVRRSGENISASEVEQVLMEMPEIAAAAIVPVPDELRGEEVKAYILPAGGASSLDPGLILDHCGRRLAKFKIPRFIAFVEAFPYTPSEKIAKHLLITDVPDLRAGAYDALDGIWR